MREFLRLVDLVNIQGAPISSSGDAPSPEEKRRYLSAFYGQIEKGIQPFVFSKDVHSPILVNDANNLVGTDPDEPGGPDSAPFRRFSIEIEGGGPIYTMKYSGSDVVTNITCLLLTGDENDRWAVHALVKEPSRDHLLIGTVGTFKQGIDLCLLRLKSEVLGDVFSSRKIRLYRQGGKLKIPKIVYVSPKRKRHMTTSTGESLSVDYSHRWLVMGHWRKVRGIGKNRKGEYCKYGRTWVPHHQKGPDDKPLITEKVRYLIPEKRETSC